MHIKNDDYTITVDVMQGLPTHPAEVVAEVTRPGISGHSYRKTGHRAKTAEIVTYTSYDSVGDMIDAEWTMHEMIGTVVEVEDEFGATWDDCVAESVEIMERRQIGVNVGGNTTDATHMIVARWSIKFIGEQVSAPTEE